MTARPDPTPAPLTVAASLVGLEGLALCGGALVTATDLSSEQLTLGLAAIGFFALCGIVLVAGAWALTQHNGWARGPALITQLILLGLAWNVRQYAVAAVLLVIVALVAVAGLLHPSTTEALESDPTP